MANIRDQCSWVHMRQKEDATHKAKDLVRMAVANARLIRALSEFHCSDSEGIGHRGGVAGMTAALNWQSRDMRSFSLRKRSN